MIAAPKLNAGAEPVDWASDDGRVTALTLAGVVREMSRLGSNGERDRVGSTDIVDSRSQSLRAT